MSLESNYWNGFLRRQATRRGVLRLSVGGVAYAAPAALAACGGRQRNPAAGPATGAAGPSGVAGSAGTPKKGGRLQLYAALEAPHLDPTLSLSAQTHHRVSLIYNKLVTFAPGSAKYDVKIVPDVADSWETSPDGLTWTFHLHPGVKWANVPPLNGRELVADDVVYTTQRNLSPQALNRSRYTMIDKVEAPDKQTIKFTLSFPHPNFLFYQASEPSEVQPREVVEQKGDLKDWGAGTGPFIITKYEPSSITVYDRNPDYFRADQVYLDGMDELTIPDQNASIAAFRTGKLDLLGYFGSQATLLKNDKDEVIKTNPKATAADYYSTISALISVKFGAQPFTDPRLRQAINHAINRDACISTLAGGDGVWTGTFPFPLYSEYTLPDDELKKELAYDPKMAKDLLSAAGFGNGLSAKFMWRSELRATVDLYVAMLKQIGITLDTASEALDYPAWVSKIYNGQFSQLAALVYGVSSIWEYIYGVLDSNGNRNSPQAKVPEIDAKIDAALHSTDHAKQVELVKEVERWALTDGLYTIPVYIAKQYMIVQPWVQNLQPRFGIASTQTSDTLAFVWLDK